MGVISLISDRRSDDFFIGRVKGQVAKTCPEAHLVDLAHNLPHFNTEYASFVIKHSYNNFPENTVHLIGIDCESGPRRDHLVVKAAGQYFVCADNGILSMVFADDEIEEIYKKPYDESNKNPALLQFTDIAKTIIRNESKDKYLVPAEDFTRKLRSNPVQEESLILGKIIYTDSYQNAVTNIDKDLFEETRHGRNFVIYAGNTSNKIRRINNTHIESEHGDLLAMFNSMGLLELSINKEPLMRLLNLRLYSEIRIEFSESEEKTSGSLF